MAREGISQSRGKGVAATMEKASAPCLQKHREHRKTQKRVLKLVINADIGLAPMP